MNPVRRGIVRASVLSIALIAVGVVALPALAATVPTAPDDIELTANADSSITIEWAASRRARPATASTAARRPAARVPPRSRPRPTPSTTTPTSAQRPIYFYQITAVNSAGESARTDEDASKTPPPIGTGGNVAGVTGRQRQWSTTARTRCLGGFDWFQTLTGWFPQVLGSSGVGLARRPGGRHGVRRGGHDDVQQRRRPDRPVCTQWTGATRSRAACSPASTTGRWA